MSLNNLMSGADCGPVNPLAQVLKHTEGDRSLQRDRVGGPSSSSLHHLPSSSTHAPSAADQAMARKFFEPSASAAPSPAFAPQQFSPAAFAQASFRGGDPRGMEEAWARPSISQQVPIGPAPGMSVGPLSGGGQWARQFDAHLSEAGSATGPAVAQSSSPIPGATTSPYLMNQGYGMYMPSYATQQPMLYQQNQQQSPAVDWDSEFAKVAATDVKGKGRIVEVTDELAEAMAKADLAEKQAAEDLAKSPDTTKEELERVWNELKSTAGTSELDDLAKWEAQYQQVLNAERDDFDYGADMQRAWEKGGFGEGLDDVMGGDAVDDLNLRFDDDGIPSLGEYVFEPNNPYLQSGLKYDYLAMAKSTLKSNGSLTEAALCLEAAIQDGQLGEGGYEAWILLGETRSMDEREDNAIRALVEGAKRAEAAGATGAGMMSLAIAYTNESYERAAYTTLTRWLHSRYPDLAPARIPDPHGRTKWAAHEFVTEIFLNVVRGGGEGAADPDVQVGLGTLFFANGEYDRAGDCFESALSARPDDFLLWNRFGSCLSNGSKPEESLGAYREALRLRPTYTRAIHNVGVACLNIGAHQEAAEHFLSALALQGSGDDARDKGNSKSAQLWLVLSRTFFAMQRQDLSDLAKQVRDGKASLDAFKEKGFYF